MGDKVSYLLAEAVGGPAEASATQPPPPVAASAACAACARAAAAGAAAVAVGSTAAVAGSAAGAVAVAAGGAAGAVAAAAAAAGVAAAADAAAVGGAVGVAGDGTQVGWPDGASAEEGRHPGKGHGRGIQSVETKQWYQVKRVCASDHIVPYCGDTDHGVGGGMRLWRRRLLRLLQSRRR